jgi:hypothetical protein
MHDYDPLCLRKAKYQTKQKFKQQQHNKKDDDDNINLLLAGRSTISLIPIYFFMH